MENQRIRLTKTLIKKALIEALEGQPIHKVTICELCKKAELNRSTFYRYYGSQYDVLEDIKKDFLRAIETYLKDVTNHAQGTALTEIMCFLETHCDTFMMLMAQLESQWSAELMALPPMKDRITEVLGEKYTQDEVAYIYGYIAKGGLEIVKTWLAQPRREPAEKIAKLITHLVRGIFE